MAAKFEISSFYDEYSNALAEQISFAVSEGLKFINLGMVDDKHIQDYRYDEFRKDKFPMLKNVMDISSFETTIGRAPLGDKEAHKEDIERLKNVVKIAYLVKCDNIRVYTPVMEEPSKEMLPEIILRFKDYLKIIEGRNVDLLIEFDALTYTRKVDKMLEVLDGINDPRVGVVFDAAKLHKAGDIPIMAHRQLRKYIKHYDIQDIDQNGINVPIGFGVSKVCDILKIAEKEGFQGFASLRPQMQEYTQTRQQLYKKTLIPVYGQLLMFSPEYKSFRAIDNQLNKKKNEEVTNKMIMQLQLRLLKKVINRPTR